ncbi:MAG: hypothetical protein HOJ55_04420 [Euryarchaeota archaeon]|nr:hypothetical protein [Euryarchaeota archaeon]
MRRIQIQHLEGSIAQSFVERLLMFECTVCIDSSLIDSYKDRYAAILATGLSSIDSSTNADISFSFFDQENIVTVESNEATSKIRLHDVLPTGSNKGLNHTFLEHLWDQKEVSHQANGMYYWVSESDVVEAFVRIALHSPLLPNTMDIAGRRGWSAQQTIDEFSMLWQRTQAASTGTFTASLLDQPPSPKISVVPIQDVVEEKRPPLGTLHDVLMQCDEQGWQPTSPLRTALMLYLAGRIND